MSDKLIGGGCPSEIDRIKKLLVRSAERRLNPMLTAWKSPVERKMTASRLLYEGSAQFLYLIAHRMESAVAAGFDENGQVINSECVMKLRSSDASVCFEALPSEI